jgi:hypothetical protein
MEEKRREERRMINVEGKQSTAAGAVETAAAAVQDHRPAEPRR